MLLLHNHSYNYPMLMKILGIKLFMLILQLLILILMLISYFKAILTFLYFLNLQILKLLFLLLLNSFLYNIFSDNHLKVEENLLLCYQVKNVLQSLVIDIHIYFFLQLFPLDIQDQQVPNCHQHFDHFTLQLFLATFTK